MSRKNTVIGIDPDVDMSGVAVLTLEPRRLELTKMAFPELVELLISLRDRRDDVRIAVEGGWLNRSNFHLRNRGQYTAARMGNDVGRNHETGRKIVEMCEHFGFETEVVRPLKKIWKGKDGKITRDELEAFAGKVGRCCQDERDAALIAWNSAGLPIRITSNF